jgi:hypothetical protein
VFAGVCNRIGEALGVGKVGVKGRDGLPDCSYWPMCVRPDGYYPEPFKAPTRQDKPAAPESESESDSDSDDDSDAPPKDVKRASARALKGAHEAARILREYIDNWAPEDAAERNDKINVRAVVWHLEQLAGPAAVPQQSDLFP